MFVVTEPPSIDAAEFEKCSQVINELRTGLFFKYLANLAHTVFPVNR